MNIWLDDLRDPKDYGIHNVIWVKSFSEFKEAIRVESPQLLYLDHDLGNDADGTGYDAFCLVEWMLHQGKLENLMCIYIHSSNSGGVTKMLSADKVFMQKYGVMIKRGHYERTL